MSQQSYMRGQRVDHRIPVTVVTGFLGSGKTTLVNHILSARHGQKVAVIVNEFGQVSIDGQLVVRDENEQLIEFNNGCLCCTVRGDLIATLGRLTQRAGQLDGILIETTGLADPAPVASTFFVSNEVKSAIRLDSFITVVDPVNLEHNLRSNEAVEQIAFADIILINKIDLASAADLERVERKIRTFNPMATIHHTCQGVVDLSLIIDTGAFELEAKLQVDPTFLDNLQHQHDLSVGSFVVYEERPVDINKFMLWMQSVLAENGQDVYRTKGLFYARGFPERLVFQSVRMLTSMRPDRVWRPSERKRTEFVVIGRSLDRAAFQQGLAACVAT
jgi:G3E family GTPase